MKKIGVVLADGFEEGESLFVIDILRRAGFTAHSISIDEDVVRGAHDIKVITDKNIKEIDKESYDMVILPGGQPGADHLAENDDVISWIQCFMKQNKWVGAICAAPLVLHKAGVDKGRTLTSYPGEKYREMFKEANYIDDNHLLEEMVIVDDHLITSRGPATTLPFVYRIVKELGEDSNKLEEMMLFRALKNGYRK